MILGCGGFVVAVAAGWAAGRNEERIIDEIEAETARHPRERS
jgi:hypothetical protein